MIVVVFRGSRKRLRSAVNIADLRYNQSLTSQGNPFSAHVVCVLESLVPKLSFLDQTSGFRDATPPKNWIFWEFFPNVGPPPPPLLGTPVSKKQSMVYFAF